MSLLRYFEAFWKVNSETGCYEWKRKVTKDGYGRTRIGSKRVHAHRLMYELANGQIPDGLQVCHRCDNRKCVNIDHLFLGTNLENHQDAKRKGRKAYGERQGLRVMTEADVILMREMYKAGARQLDLAIQFKISQPTVSQILRRITWQYLP